MSVLVEVNSIIVRREALDRVYPGGAAAYEVDCPNQTFCADEHLTRVGFMTSGDVSIFIHRLEERGLTSFDGERSVDIALLMQGEGPVWPCDWIEHERHPEGYDFCWLTGTEPGTLAAPDWWTPENSRGIGRVRIEGDTLRIQGGRVGPGDRIYIASAFGDDPTAGEDGRTRE